MNDGTQRRLAAIVSADVVGYSRLMGRDEAGTLRRLNEHRSELIDPLIDKHGGRIVKTTGDGLLLEFPSVVAAVECCVAVQVGMVERNSDAGDDAIRFRIGVHLGDVIVEGADIFGDGVNIAARLQEIGEAGGVTISSNAHDSIEGRIEAAFSDGGEQELKNIARPVRIWRWGEATEANDTALPDAPLPLPDKPSIAVLPFDNMSNDPEQEYFSDGITEDIITALSKFRWFLVTARNSTFTYKGRATDIKQVGRELGVRYVMEGSVRKAGNRVRITAQLIEAETGNHLWAERYDRQLVDIFDLQDEITQTVAAAVEPELAAKEQQRATQKPTSDMAAWDLYQRSTMGWLDSSESTAATLEYLRQAIALDPKFGLAHGRLALTLSSQIIIGWTEDRETAFRDAMAAADRAIDLDPRDYIAHYAHGRLSTISGDVAAGIQAFETAINLNPSFALGYNGLGSAYLFSGPAERVVEGAEMAIRLSPNDPLVWAFWLMKGTGLWALGRKAETIAAFERAIQCPNTSYVPFAGLASVSAFVGNLSEAHRVLERLYEREPTFTIKQARELVERTAPMVLDDYLEGLRMAGVPEE